MSICNGEISESSASDLFKRRGVRFGSQDMEDEIVSVRSLAITEAKPFGDSSLEFENCAIGINFPNSYEETF
ncbi:hypothetical protein TNCV_707721 [Trichonephila clavipes]|nr:hypothetical protein TNCV_707721 [Trichonephila clavipes]